MGCGFSFEIIFISIIFVIQVIVAGEKLLGQTTPDTRVKISHRTSYLMLPSFTYESAVSIVSGIGRALKIGEELPSFCAGTKTFIITDPGIVEIGLVEKVVKALKRDEYVVDLFYNVKSDPTAGSIDTAADKIRSASPSIVIGLGGGSAIDVAKLSTVLASGQHGAEHYTLMAHPLPDRKTKMIMLPTTAGTGAEVSRTAVFSDANHRKVWVWGNELRPDRVILDPELTVTLPAHLTTATGLDAMVHAIEACTNRSSHPFVQALGLHAIRLVIQNLEKAVEIPHDLVVRGRLLMASTMAGMAIDGAGTGIAHAIGQALGTIAGVHHGRAVALAQDVVFARNVQTAVDIHVDIARALRVEDKGEPSKELALKGAKAFHDFVIRTGIQPSLRQDGLSEKDLDRLVDVILSEENKPMCDNNCYRASQEDIREFALVLLTR